MSRYVLSPFEVEDAGPFQYNDLPVAGDADLESQLQNVQVVPLENLLFRLVRAPLAELREVIPAADYKTERDGGEYPLVSELIERFERGEAPVAIVFLWEWYRGHGEPRIVDGLHRASAARAAGHEDIAAFECINWEWRGVKRA